MIFAVHLRTLPEDIEKTTNMFGESYSQSAVEEDTDQGPRRVFESGVGKKCFQPQSGEKYFLALLGGSGGMLFQKILKTKCLRLA